MRRNRRGVAQGPLSGPAAFELSRGAHEEPQGRRAGPALPPMAWAVTAVLALSLGAHAESPSSRLDSLLDRTAQVVGKSLVEFSDVACRESVTQTKIGKNGKPEFRENSLFDYLVMFQGESGEPVMVESRLQKEASEHKGKAPLLLTNGFSTMLLIFHPYYSGGFQFTDLGEYNDGGHPFVKVHFQHVKGLQSTSVLLLKSREYPLDFQGTALIDKATGNISKIHAGLETPMDDVGLKSLETDVEYAPIRFQGAKDAYWLPTSAVIEAESTHQHWRNEHHFSEYHRFETSVKENIRTTQ